MDDVAEATVAAASPAAFAHVTSKGKWKPFEHLLMIDDYLLRLAAGEFDRLLVETSVRHGKSELISHYLPAWWLGRKPDDQIILSSYEATFAGTWGRKARDTLSYYGPKVFGVAVAEHPAAVSEWCIQDRKGIMITAGVGGALTGRGADCLPGETIVSTERGPIRIDRLAAMPIRPRALVRSPDGAQGYASIEAALTRNATDLFQITTDSGHRLRATGRHRIFVSGRGYVQAQDLRSGDRVLVTPPAQGLPAMRSTHERLQGSLSRVLQRVALSRCRGDLRLVRDADHQEGLRVAQGDSSGTHGHLLFSRLLEEASRGQEQTALHRLWRTLRAQDAQILLRRLSSVGAASKAEARLSVLRRLLPAKVLASVVLQPLVRQRRTLSKDARLGQLPLPGWPQLREVVSRNASRCAGARWRAVCSLPRPRAHDRGLASRLETSAPPINPSHPSPRRGPDEQRGYEPCDSVRELSHNLPQVEEAAIVGVERVCTPSLPVYDLQVEGTSNFFADGVLVHNCLIIDDPVKNAEEAASEVYRQKAWDWWQSTASTRLQPGGKVVVVMARWHEDDLAGRIQANQDPSQPWAVLRLPALAEDNDPLGRKPGDALCPELYDEDALKRAMQERGSYWFNALYQQRPAPAEGLLFKRKDFRYWDSHGEGDNLIYRLKEDGESSRTISANVCTKFQTIDAAASEKEMADFTAVSTWLATPYKDLILLDVKRQKFETLQLEEFLTGVSDEHGRPPMWIETLGAGRVPHKQLIARGYPVRELKPEYGSKTAKVQRAMVAVAFYEQHKVFHPDEFREGDFEHELVSFPSGAFDDQVDTLSYAAQLLPTMATIQEVRKPSSGTIMGNLSDRRW